MRRTGASSKLIFLMSANRSNSPVKTSQYNPHSGISIVQLMITRVLNVPQDSAVVQDSDGEGKIVYLFLPLYKVRSVV